MMKLSNQGNSLVVTGFTELSAGNAGEIREPIRTALTGTLSNIDMDLSQVQFIDSGGLGLLVALQKTAAERQGRIRLLNPTPRVQQILELTRLHRVFEIVRS